MSAALVILPRIWACSAAAESSISSAAASVLAIQTGQRKAPHTLRLVRAQTQPGRPVAPQAVLQMPLRVNPELAFYRRYTEALLQRFLTLSMESGRVPSLLGQEMFRGRVTSYKVTGFDDVVIFVEDVTRCLRLLEPGQQHLLRRIAIEGYTLGETSAMLGITLRTIVRRYNEALDRLTRVFLDRKLLQPLSPEKEEG